MKKIYIKAFLVGVLGGLFLVGIGALISQPYLDILLLVSAVFFAVNTIRNKKIKVLVKKAIRLKILMNLFYIVLIVELTILLMVIFFANNSLITYIEIIYTILNLTYIYRILEAKKKDVCHVRD